MDGGALLDGSGGAESAALNASLGLVTNVVLGEKASPSLWREFRRLWSPAGSIVVVPRDSPSMADTFSVEEFRRAASRGLAFNEQDWIEYARDLAPAEGRYQRITSWFLSASNECLTLTWSTLCKPAFRVRSCVIVHEQCRRHRRPDTFGLLDRLQQEKSRHVPVTADSALGNVADLGDLAERNTTEKMPLDQFG